MVKKAQSMQQRGAIIIDVREQNEWDSGYIANAIHIPLNEIKQRIFELSSYKNHSLILQCRSGGRSIKAIDILKNAGFSKLYNMTGGLTAWTEMGLPLK